MLGFPVEVSFLWNLYDIRYIGSFQFQGMFERKNYALQVALMKYHEENHTLPERVKWITYKLLLLFVVSYTTRIVTGGGGGGGATLLTWAAMWRRFSV